MKAKKPKSWNLNLMLSSSDRKWKKNGKVFLDTYRSWVLQPGIQKGTDFEAKIIKLMGILTNLSSLTEL